MMMMMMMMIDGISLLYIEASIHVRPWGMSIERQRQSSADGWSLCLFWCDRVESLFCVFFSVCNVHTGHRDDQDLKLHV